MNERPRSGRRSLGRCQELVVHTDSFDGTLVDANPAVGAKAGVNSGLLFTFDSLGWADINTGFTGVANIRVNFRWHFSTSLAGNPVPETIFHITTVPESAKLSDQGGVIVRNEGIVVKGLLRFKFLILFPG